jgi:hypothetical protein
MPEEQEDEQYELDLVGTLEEVFGKENVFVFDEESVAPDPVDRLSEFDLSHIDDILHGLGDWWTAHFIRLYNKSDSAHRAALGNAFPTIVSELEKWRTKQEA